MKFGLSLPSSGSMAQPEQLAVLAQHAEQRGFYIVTIGDHIVIPERIRARYPYAETGEPPAVQFSGEWLEQLTVLSFIAAKTSRIRLMSSVMVLPHRHPLLAAKMLATIDVLSEGRLTVGVGVGWMKDEFEVLGLPPFDERGSVADEYIHIFKEAWTSESPRFQGKYFSFSGVKFLPKPIQKPHPPIWVGGESPRAIKRAAELGEGWYPSGSNHFFPLRRPDQLESAIAILVMYVERAGRRLKDIEIGYIVPEYRLVEESASKGGSEDMFVGDAHKIASDIRRYEKLGVSLLRFNLQRESLKETIEHIDKFAKEIMPKVS